jgi:predicted acylesterase/phospholipase RssA
MDTITSVVFSGGGTKGVAYLGVLKKLRELQKENNPNVKIDIKRVVCVSIGCLFGLILLLNYEYEEIEEEIMEKDFKLLQDIKITNFVSKFGLDSGKNIIRWIETLIIKKGLSKDITFGELYKCIPKQYTILATNLNKHKCTEFDHIHTPNIKVTDAIRMSTSIPFVFTRITYNGDVHVDGGLISNFPMHLVEDDIPNVLGVRLVSMEENALNNIDNKVEDITEFCVNVMSCFMAHREKQSVESNKYADYTMLVCTGDLSNTIKFDMDSSTKRELIDRGYNAADMYFKQRNGRVKLQKEKMVGNNKESANS